MKKITFLFLIFSSIRAFAQDPDLFNYQWELSHLEINGIGVFPPANTEASPVPLQFFSDNTFTTNVCNTGVGSLTFNNSNYTFTIPPGGLAVTLMMCIFEENDLFESSYYGFYFNNISSPFAYDIINLGGSMQLIITGANNNKAYYSQGPLAVETFAATSWAVYPNPAEGKLNFKFSEIPAGDFTIEIYDLLGKLCIDKLLTTGSTSIDVEELKPGIYMINYADNTLSGSTKFIKK